MSEQVIYSPLSKYLSVIRNGTVSTQVSEITEFPVTRIETIADGTIDLSKIGYLADKISTYKLEKWDILYSHINSFKHVGKVAQYEGGKDLYHGMNLLLLRPNEHIDPKYLYYSLSSSQAKRYAQKECQKAINQVSLNTKTVGAYEFYVPPIYEQKVIAKILYTLDTQIRQTEAIIVKLQKIKQGLLNDLLTRGIDSSGQLRMPREQAPELYKDSQLGWIPKEWEALPLGDLLFCIEGGWSPNCTETRPASGEWGVLKVSAVTGGVYKDYEAKALPHTLNPKPNIEVRSGDVILTRANGNPDLVGNTVLVEFTQEKLMLSDKLLRLVPAEALSAEFLVFLMSFYKTKGQISILTSGSSGQKNISQAQIKNLLVPSAPYEEQLASTKRVRAISERIFKESNKLSKMKLEKAGLMDDLLTGRVRVTDLIEQQRAS
ncbi:restriction endonuclease subunit S [Halomonas sp. FME1]|uniref:Restriction endonuclease subunit S n=1 Tax=Halomonas casei TaxID=2742613 RepID=A0ABR9F1I1_9GAMM|nr:restriction endonuclease subunit S [Halomonas casei]MBE0400317.1 restriction endonuclease subunit S [Halomonas casei]